MSLFGFESNAGSIINYAFCLLVSDAETRQHLNPSNFIFCFCHLDGMSWHHLNFIDIGTFFVFHLENLSKFFAPWQIKLAFTQPFTIFLERVK
jgi:hypothetical protein